MTEKRTLVASMVGATPYARYLGIGVVANGDAESVSFHLPFEARLVGNGTLPAYHGGVIATFMQVVALTTVNSHLFDNRLPKLVDFSVDYLSSAGPSDLYATCEMYRLGRRIATVGVRCWQKADVPVALGRAQVFVGPRFDRSTQS